jgi:hypothetical protein
MLFLLKSILMRAFYLLVVWHFIQSLPGGGDPADGLALKGSCTSIFWV